MTPSGTSTPRSFWARSTAIHRRRSSTTLCSGDHSSAISRDAYRAANTLGTLTTPPFSRRIRARSGAIPSRVRWVRSRELLGLPLGAGVGELLGEAFVGDGEDLDGEEGRVHGAVDRNGGDGHAGRHLDRGVEGVDAVEGAAAHRHADDRQRRARRADAGEVGCHAGRREDHAEPVVASAGADPASSRPWIGSPVRGDSGYPSEHSATVTAASAQNDGVERNLPSAASRRSSAGSLVKRGSSACASGSPKRTLYSTIFGPSSVSM